jgi:hypothetical protein
VVTNVVSGYVDVFKRPGASQQTWISNHPGREDRLGDNISEARRAGDADPEKKIVAETRKLDGNSSYGKTVTNKERHTNVIYCQEHQVSRYLVDPSFRRCNQLSAKTFEVEMSKKTIRLDLPMQIGCFVYQYAQFRMLEFYYDFMDVLVDRSDFQFCAMDTDSAYMALLAKVVLCTKAKEGLATQGNHSIPIKFGLKQTRRSFIVGGMFGGVCTLKPILLLLHIWFDHFFQTGSGQSHISTICVHGAILEVPTIHKNVYEIVVKLQHPELGVPVDKTAKLHG